MLPTRLNLIGGVDIGLPNVSYCEDIKDVHYTPYNLVRFYVGEVTGSQTVKIYTDLNTSVDIEVSEGNKWYTYVLPKDKGLCIIEGDSVKNVVVKSNISYEARYQPPFVYCNIIPSSTIEASFKGSNTSKVTTMDSMFDGCSCLTSLDLSNFDTSNVTDMTQMFDGCSGLAFLDLSGWNMSKVINISKMSYMFRGCTSLTTIRMKGCSEATIKKIEGVKPSSAIIVTE